MSESCTPREILPFDEWSARYKKADIKEVCRQLQAILAAHAVVCSALDKFKHPWLLTLIPCKKRTAYYRLHRVREYLYEETGKLLAFEDYK